MAAFSYSFAVDKYTSRGVTAEIAGEECRRLAASEEGLTPETLLDANRSADAPLHSIFEWDDLIAAEKYRIGQARELIINLRVTIDDGEQAAKERAFVLKPSGHSAYAPLTSAITNSEWREMLLQQAADDAEMFVAKYRRLQELAPQIAAMEQIAR